LGFPLDGKVSMFGDNQSVITSRFGKQPCKSGRRFLLQRLPQGMLKHIKLLKE
jgi:hypothetical protein